MKEIENVSEAVLYHLSQDNCAFTASQLTVMQPDRKYHLHQQKSALRCFVARFAVANISRK